MKVKNTYITGYKPHATSSVSFIYELEDGTYIMYSGNDSIRIIDEKEFQHWIEKDGR